tara:strand:+ start:7507 stop:8487 length:981 start_codon:yes stop_codon:yes gene_type:complete
MSKSKAVKIVNNFRAPKKVGVHHRLLCLTGRNKGVSYYIAGRRVVLGRSDKIDIQVLDEKASREHAEIVNINGDFILTDLKSQNGTVVEDLKITQHKLSNGDKIIIGATVLKFEVFNIESEYEIEVAESEKLPNEEIEDEQKKKDAKKKGNIRLIVIVSVLAVLFLFDSGEKESENKKTNRRRLKDVTSAYEQEQNKKKNAESLKDKKNVEAIIHRGQREFREQNYFRALEEFQQALILDPGNGRAMFYKRKTKQALDESTEKLFLKARREMEGRKLKSAANSYCAIIRLLRGYDDDERYELAENQINFIENKLGMDEGEFRCLKK